MSTVRRPRRSSQRGFSLLEAVVSFTVLAAGLLAHVASVTSEQTLQRETQSRMDALQAGRQVLARLRADDDWPTIYVRLKTQLDKAGTNAPGVRRLRDGRIAFAPSTYFPSFVPPERLQDLGILIEVPPRARPTSKPTGKAVLREDANLPAFGMPTDLDLDGDVDGESVESTYAVLPVVVILAWRGASGGSEEMRMPAWLWGDR